MGKKEKRKNTKENSEVEVEIKSSKAKNQDTVESETDERDIEQTTPETTEEKTSEQIIAEYEDKLEELNDSHLRLAAEFDNYKKRTARQFEDIIKNSSVNIISQILEVVDNLERALESSSKTDDFKALQTGAEMIYQQLYDILKKEGLEPIKSVGENFDPNLHEAMMQAESEEYPEGVIISEMVKGYKLNGKVIRFSKVIVSSGNKDNEDKEADNN
jgi:molecular chaperone GrpE